MRHIFFFTLLDFLKQNPIILSNVSDKNKLSYLRTLEGTKAPRREYYRKAKKAWRKTSQQGISSEWMGDMYPHTAREG